MDCQVFLGGSEPTTLKELSEALGKETIDTFNTSDTRGNSPSYGTNYQKLGKELVEVSIPNPDKADIRPWESFVISPKMIHDNQFGRGVWMKLPEDGTTRLSRSVKTGIDETGRSIWGRETREVTNTELKSLMESYKDKSRGSVLLDLSGRKEETAAASPGTATIWIRLDTGEKYARSAKYLERILEALGCRKAEQNE